MPRKRTGYDAACYYDGKLLGRCTKADSDAYGWKWLERMRPLSTMKLSTRYRLSYSVIPVLPRKAVRYIYSAAF